jgi:hypothetical protein
MERLISSDFSLVRGIKDDALARHEIWRVVEEMRAKDRLLSEELVGEFELLEHSTIPPSGGDAITFLALHFDRGHALFPDKPETVVAFVALYFPVERAPGSAITRVVPLVRLLAKSGWGDRGIIEERLRGYTTAYGSSWDWDGDSGGRVSCFARVLDGLAAVPGLTNFKETPKYQWYATSRAGHEFDSYEGEAQFYQSLGIDMRDAEIGIKLSPGDVLVLNNIRTIHGRLGARQSGEVDQYLIGRRNVPASECAIIRRWLVSLLADDKRAAYAT